MSDAVTIESGRISKKNFQQQEAQLRVDLINAQYDLREADFNVVILLMGTDRVGLNGLAARLNEWMDARYIDTEVFGAPTQEERERPRFWRYWRALPAKGRTAIYGGAWPLNILADRLNGQLDKKAFKLWLRRAANLERDWTEDGTLLLKYWVHLPRKELKKRLDRARKDPDRAWWMEQQDWDVFEQYSKISKTVNAFYSANSESHTPWTIIDGTDDNFRDLTVATGIRDALTARLENPPAPSTFERAEEHYEDALGKVDLSKRLEKADYRKQLEKYQRRFHRLMRQAHVEGVSSVLAFEGWDAGGKGGTIRRLTNALPARSYKVVPIAAPNEEERAHHYLWRFWRALPRQGQLLIFDRTWYGRVTVERIEKFASPAEWNRAYGEINDFEEQLAERGILVQKFWLHISPEEQLTRFKARELTPYKKHKITDEDYRNRSKWDDYALAVNEMVAKTHRHHAPWHLVPANDKLYARIYVLKTVCEGLERALDGALMERS